MPKPTEAIVNSRMHCVYKATSNVFIVFFRLILHSWSLYVELFNVVVVRHVQL